MKLNPKLLAIIGRLNPAIYDAVFPHGPILKNGGPGGIAARQAASDLAPMGVGAAAATHFAATQWTARRLGIAFDGDPDDWCPTGRPFKLPPGVVFPPEPEPQPDWLAAFYLGFASRLSVLAEAADPADRAGLGKAMDRALGLVEKTAG